MFLKILVVKLLNDITNERIKHTCMCMCVRSLASKQNKKKVLAAMVYCQCVCMMVEVRPLKSLEKC